MTKKKLLFIAYGGSHIKLLLPVIRRLFNDENYQILIFGLPGAIPDLKRNNLNYISYLNFVSDIPNEFFTNETISKIVEDNHNPNLNFSKFESLAYLVINVFNFSLEHKLTFDEASKKIKEIGRQVFYPVKFFKNIFSIIKPDAIISTISPKSERAALKAGRDSNIISISLDDLFGNHYVHDPVAEYHFVMSDYVKDMYSKKLSHQDKIFNTGNPYLEDYFNDYTKESATIFTEKIILFLYQNMYFDNKTKKIIPIPMKGCEKFVKNLSASANKNGYTVAIRNHPNLQMRDRIKVDSVLNFDSISLNESLAKSIYIVGFDSTVLLQSLIVGKEIVEIKFNDYVSTLALTDKGLSKEISLNDSPERISSVIFNSTLGKIKNKSINYFVGHINATKRVINQLNTIINEAHKF